MDEESRLAWDDYRRRQRLLTRIILGGSLTCAILFIVGQLAGVEGIVQIALLLWVPCMIAYIVAYNYLLAFRCPRCHKKFFCTTFSHNAVRRTCAHCTLPKWGSADEPAPLWWHNPGKFEWPEPKNAPPP